jgi:hypothetical protein
MKNRGPRTKASFIEQIADSEFECSVAAEVWNILRGRSDIPDFEPSPDDDLCYLYGIAEEDLDEDIILFLLNLFEVPVPPIPEVDAFGPVNTPKDIVKLISRAQALAHP